MRSSVVAAAGALVGVCGLFLAVRHTPAAAAAPSGAGAPRQAIVVELFSSEGCSSCPPADAWLAAMDRAQSVDGVTVIAMEENVDYWDRLGWRDPFGSAAFSDRQQEYARVLPDRQVFTPEVIFDGHLVMPGGDEEAARALMQRSAREPKAHVALRRDGLRVTVDVSGTPPWSADDVPEVWLAVTESGLSTDVKAGENAGRHLAHAPVVRRLRSLGPLAGSAVHVEATLDLEPAWKPAALRTIAFVQLAKSRRIEGAAIL